MGSAVLLEKVCSGACYNYAILSNLSIIIPYLQLCLKLYKSYTGNEICYSLCCNFIRHLIDFPVQDGSKDARSPGLGPTCTCDDWKVSPPLLLIAGCSTISQMDFMGILPRKIVWVPDQVQQCWMLRHIKVSSKFSFRL